jgi:hypothetical protein
MCSDSYSQSDKKSVGYCPECDRSVDEDGISTEESCYWSESDEPCKSCGYDFAECNDSC